MSSANKTKDWLKNQLVSHGIPLPSSTAKKEEYQRLYDEQVLPKQNNTEFSSDDDTEETSQQDTPTRSPSVSNNSRPDSKTQNGTDGSTDKHSAWVLQLSDKNLFTALKANGREVGGIVESTRALYRNMLIELLKKDEKKAVSEIESYLSQNEDARKLWLEEGVTNGFTNGTNGNSNSNGYSDSDDDETVETASRASRSSRASSKRMTPIRNSASSPPAKESTPTTHRTAADSNVKSRRATGAVRDDMLDGINEVDDDVSANIVTASATRAPQMSDSFLYNRVSSPPDSSLRFNTNKPYTSRKTVVETVEKTRMYAYEHGESSESATSQQRQRSVPPKAAGGPGPRALVILKYLLLLITVLVIPLLAYYFFGRPDNSENCTGSECVTDDLDVILQSLDEQEPVGVANEA